MTTTHRRYTYVTSKWRAPTETFVRREIEAARRAGHIVEVLSLKPAEAVEEGDPLVIHIGRLVALHALVTIGRHPIRSARSLYRAARGARLDTVRSNVGSVLVGLAADRRVPPSDWIHAHFAWVAAGAADALAQVRGQRFSVFAHAFDIFDRRFVDGYTRSKLRRAALVAVESPSIQEEVDEHFGCRSSVVRMGVPRSFVHPDPAARDVQDGLILSVGSLVPKKGHDVLLRALALLPRAQLIVIGSGPEQARLANLTRDLGLTERVRWLGALPESQIVEWLDRAAVFVLASRSTGDGDRDGVPNVLIEAMARAVPCVSTEVSGIPDLLADGRGAVVPPEDPSALAEALERGLDAGETIARQVRSAYEHVSEHYVTERNWALLEAQIEQALTARSAAVRAYYRTTPDAVDEDRQQSPYWLRRWVHDTIHERFEPHLHRGQRVLDAGCGEGHLSARIARAGSLPVALDLSPANVKSARTRVADHGMRCLPVVADLERLPFAASSFDLVVSSHALEHLSEPDRGAAELSRVARAAVVVAMPTCTTAAALPILGGDIFWRISRRSPYAWLIGIARILAALVRGSDGPNEGYRGDRSLVHIWRFPWKVPALMERQGLQVTEVVAGPLTIPYLPHYIESMRTLQIFLDRAHRLPGARWLGMGVHVTAQRPTTGSMADSARPEL